jgi:hypothetical protein
VADSSTWLQRLRAAKADIVPAGGQSIARSPIVLRDARADRRYVRWPKAKLTWNDLLKKSPPSPKSRSVSSIRPAMRRARRPARDERRRTGQWRQRTQTATATLRALAAGSSSYAKRCCASSPRDRCGRRWPVR